MMIQNLLTGVIAVIVATAVTVAEGTVALTFARFGVVTIFVSASAVIFVGAADE